MFLHSATLNVNVLSGRERRKHLWWLVTDAFSHDTFHQAQVCSSLYMKKKNSEKIESSRKRGVHNWAIFACWPGWQVDRQAFLQHTRRTLDYVPYLIGSSVSLSLASCHTSLTPQLWFPQKKGANSFGKRKKKAISQNEQFTCCVSVGGLWNKGNSSAPRPWQ